MGPVDAVCTKAHGKVSSITLNLTMIIHNSFRENNLPLDVIKKDDKMGLDSSLIHLQ